MECVPQESLPPIASDARSRYANHRIFNSSNLMNKIVFVEDDAEVGNLIAAYLGMTTETLITMLAAI